MFPRVAHWYGGCDVHTRTEVHTNMSHKSFIAGAAIAVAGIAFMPTLSQAQESAPAQPLQVTSPAPHDESQGAAPAQAQTTARGELVSIDEKGKMLTIKSDGSEMSFKFDD